METNEGFGVAEKNRLLFKINPSVQRDKGRLNERAPSGSRPWNEDRKREVNADRNLGDTVEANSGRLIIHQLWAGKRSKLSSKKCEDERKLGYTVLQMTGESPMYMLCGQWGKGDLEDSRMGQSHGEWVQNHDQSLYRTHLHLCGRTHLSVSFLSPLFASSALPGNFYP